MNSHKDREPRNVGFSDSLMLESDRRTNLWRVSSLSIVEARTDLELDSSNTVLDSQSSEHAGTSPGSFLMAYDHSLSIVKLLDFEKPVASSLLVFGSWILDHETLTLHLEYPVHFLIKMGNSSANGLLVENNVFLGLIRPVVIQLLLNNLESQAKLLAHLWCVVNHVGDLLPCLFVRLLLLDDTDCLLEVVSVGPELTIQSKVLWQQVFEPLGWIEQLTSSTVEVGPVPVSSDSV